MARCDIVEGQDKWPYASRCSNSGTQRITMQSDPALAQWYGKLICAEHLAALQDAFGAELVDLINEEVKPSDSSN